MSFIDQIFDRTIPSLNKTLDLRWKRNEAITSNITNAETPGYRAVDVSFAGELENAFQRQATPVRKTLKGHQDIQSSGLSHLVADYSGATKPDGNNVDLDIQMGKLVKNAGSYSQAASLVRKKLHMMRMAIRQSMR